MPLSLIITEKAQEDLGNAFQWYEDQEPGLGKKFTRCIDDKITDIKRHPLHHQVILSNQVRRALINRFPFSIYFVIEVELITIFAILHQRRSPEYWKSRM